MKKLQNTKEKLQNQQHAEGVPQAKSSQQPQYLHIMWTTWLHLSNEDSPCHMCLKGLLKSLGRSRRTSARSASDGSGSRLAFAGRIARRAHSITPRLARFSFSESPKGRFSKWESQVWQMAELLSGPNPSAPPSSPEQAVSLKANIHLPTRISRESKLAFTHTLDCCLGSRSWLRKGHECKSLCSYTFAQLTIDCCPCRGRLQTHQRMQPKQIMHLLQLNSYQLPPCFWSKQRAMKYISPQCWSIVGGQ